VRRSLFWTLTVAASLLAGLFAGLGTAAAGLAVVGQPLLHWEPARVQSMLVAGPLLGLGTMAGLAFASSRYPAVARHARACLACWAITAIAVTFWFGLRPLLG
jgi:hypothetical protein